MSPFLPPAGVVAPNARKPFDPDQQPAFDLPAFPQDGPSTPTTPRETIREFRDEITAWRQTSTYIGDVSSDIEVGLGAPVSGPFVRSVQIRVRTEFAGSSTAYYTIVAQWRDADGNASELGRLTTETTLLPAHVRTWVWQVGDGVRLIDGSELTVTFTATGSPAALTGVQLYADWLVGV